jgi:hypothetical protein
MNAPALAYYATLAAIFVVSMWLRNAFPIFAIAPAMHDDALFVKLADSISRGDWLGDYNNLTHAKGIGYSLFLVVNHIAGLPLKLAEHLLYLLAALFLASLFGKVYRTRWAGLAVFALLAFIPTAWNPGVSGRVMREGFYVSLSLLMLALAMRCFVVSKRASLWEELRGKWPSLVLLGLVGGVYWLTREEGVWLLPSAIIILAYWLWSRWPALRPRRAAALFVALPLLSAMLVIGAVNTLNYHWYGVFRNNDFRSTDFVSAYGALSRIKHDHWQRFVVFPSDARERAYRFSSAARELRPSFEGRLGANWRQTGCNQTGISPCPEILSGWFMWALRDAVAAGGHYRSATDARLFYTRLASEINVACDQHAEECLPRRDTMVPPWRNAYLLDTAKASQEVFHTLVTLGGAHASTKSSVGQVRGLDLFARITNGPLAPTQPQKTETGDAWSGMPLAMRVAGNLARIEQVIAEIGIPAAMLALLAWCLVAVYGRLVDVGLVTALALAAAVAARVVLLGFLDATSIPSNNMLYLSPVAPMALALIPAVFFGIVASIRRARPVVPIHRAVTPEPPAAS